MSGIYRVFAGEFRRIFTLAPVFAVVVLGSLAYSVFYPQPYVNEALRNVPIAVVDQDRTDTSRQIIQAVDTNSDVAVTQRFADMPSAERAVFARQVYGILFIPRHFERDLLHGTASPLAVYGDASYFLIYQRIAEAVSTVAATFGARIEASRLVAAGADPRIAAAAVNPMPLTAVPLFNPEGGYATYILPAAFSLIVQQILLIGVGMLGTLPGSTPAPGPDGRRPGPVATILGKLCAYLVIETFILPFYLIILPWLYGLPRLGSLADTLLFALPFILAVASLGLLIAEVFRTALGIQLAMASLGLPFFFLAGFSWPSEAIPAPMRLLALLVPSSSALDGFVNLNQMGAHLNEVLTPFAILWGLAAVYTGLAIVLEAARRHGKEPQEA